MLEIPGPGRHVALPDLVLREPAQPDPRLRLGVREGHGGGQTAGKRIRSLIVQCVTWPLIFRRVKVDR